MEPSIYRCRLSFFSTAFVLSLLFQVSGAETPTNSTDPEESATLRISATAPPSARVVVKPRKGLFDEPIEDLGYQEDVKVSPRFAATPQPLSSASQSARVAAKPRKGLFDEPIEAPGRRGDASVASIVAAKHQSPSADPRSIRIAVKPKMGLFDTPVEAIGHKEDARVSPKTVVPPRTSLATLPVVHVAERRRGGGDRNTCLSLRLSRGQEHYRAA